MGSVDLVDRLVSFFCFLFGLEGADIYRRLY